MLILGVLEDQETWHLGPGHCQKCRNLGRALPLLKNLPRYRILFGVC